VFERQRAQKIKYTKKRIKVQVRFTYTAPQAASAALCVTDRAGVQPRLQPKLALSDFGLQPYSRM